MTTTDFIAGSVYAIPFERRFFIMKIIVVDSCAAYALFYRNEFISPSDVASTADLEFSEIGTLELDRADECQCILKEPVTNAEMKRFHENTDIQSFL